MRFALESSASSASASEVEGSEKGSDDEQGSVLSISPQARRRTSNLDRVNVHRARQSSDLKGRRRRSDTPKWMRESTPLGDEDDRNRTAQGLAANDTEGFTSPSASDSEEEQWPVSPRRYGKKFESRQLGRREPSMEAQELGERIRLANEVDAYVPRRTISRRLASRQASASPKTIKKVLNAGERVDEDDTADVQRLLASLKIKRDADEKREKDAFEQSEKALWSIVENSIRLTEQARAKAEEEEAERRRRAQEEEEATKRKAQAAAEAKEKKEREEKEAAEKASKEAAERAAAIEQAQTAKLAEAAKEKELSTSVGNGLVHGAAQQYEKWTSKMQEIKQNVLPAVSNNADWRKQCFGAKRIITRCVGQLTNSRAEIVRITQTIGDVLTQAKDASPNGEIHTWILNHLSKCLIRQAEQEVAAKQDTAFPLARVIVWLLLEGHTALGEVLMARLTKKCCWCLAFCPAKKPDQDEASYAKTIGKAGMDEATLQYTSRMSGIMAMYFAVCQTTPTTPPSQQALDVSRIPNSMRPSALWIWQARMVSPRMLEHTVAPALLSTMIEIAGPCLLSTYGVQCRKVWTLLLVEGLGNRKAGFTQDKAANSARVRLQLLLEEWSKAGVVQGATEGREMEA